MSLRADRLIEAKLVQTGATPQRKRRRQPDKKKPVEKETDSGPVGNVSRASAGGAWPGYGRAPASALGRALWFSDMAPGKQTPSVKRVAARS